jgi:hypothetical protein
MAQQPDGEQRIRTTQSSESAAPSGEPPASRTRSAPPPRPGISYSAPPPIAVTPQLPRPVRLARTLWLLSFATGMAVVVTSFLSRDAHLERLRTVVNEMAPGGGPDALTASTAIVFWGSVITMLLVIVLEAAALGIVMGRQGWARWLMIPLLLGHAFATWLAGAFLIPAGDAGSYVALLWGAQLLFAFAGLILLFVPASGAWLRSRQQVP